MIFEEMVYVLMSKSMMTDISTQTDLVKNNYIWKKYLDLY